MNKNIVYAQLPNAGLGNILFVWARAYIFAKTYNLPFRCSGWRRLKIGPILRGEKVKRFYGGYFKSHNTLNRIFFNIIYKQKNKFYNPLIGEFDAKHELIYYFDSQPPMGDRFKFLKDDREAVIDAVYTELRQKYRKELEHTNAPIIGVHIRKGDFREADIDEKFDFAHSWGVRAPDDYYISSIKMIREIIGENVPVMVFSDGRDKELARVLKLENTSIAPVKSDILDMLLLSNCKIIVTSPSSTFSYWAAFLSDAIVIRHPDFIRSPLRSDHVNAKFYEGPLPNNIEALPELLKSNLKALSDD